MSLTEDVAATVAEIKYDALPEHVRDKAKLLVLDHVGCMIAGSKTRGAAYMTPYLASIDSGGPSTVFGTSMRFHPTNAAHANAHSASMLSLDDSYILFGHPGASIIPAALAVAEEVGSSGKELITAIVGGYEMSLRLGTAIRSSENRDLHVKGYASWQIFGACTAASLLHRFSTEQIADAYGLVPMHAPLPFLRKFHSRPMSLLKNNYGWANKGAITAVDLVRAGFHGNRTIFDGDDGFWAMAGSDRFEPRDMLNQWGERYFIVETGFKPFGVCRWIHTAIDCLRALLTRHPFGRADIEGVHVETVSEFVRDFNGPWPQSTIEAAFHIPYALALELHDKSSATGLREEDLTDEDLRKTAARISVSILAGADEKFYAKKLLPARVSITLKNGKTLSAEAEIPTGAPGGPAFGHQEVEAKFLTLVSPVIDEVNAVRLKEALLDLDSLTVRDALRYCTLEVSSADLQRRQSAAPLLINQPIKDQVATMSTPSAVQPKTVHRESSATAFYAGRGVAKLFTVSHGKGIFFWDTNGKRYLDGSSGAVVANIGHGNERVRDAMIDQVNRISYVIRTAFTSDSTNTLCKMISDLAGPGFDQTFLVSGGSEAVESALKLARQYAVVTGQSKRSKILARMPGYHGATAGAAAVTGDPDRDEMFGPIMRIMPKVPAPVSYRIPDGFDVDSYADHCADALERQILAEGEETVLAFIMEPVGGVASGALVAPDHYYSKVRKICDRYGVLLIFDEVMSGAGRSGTFLAAHHWPTALPDIVVCAKGLSAGYTPLGAMIAPNRIVDKVVESGGFLHGHTYSGNPLSAAIGVAVLEEMLDHNLMANAEHMGVVLRRKLNALKDRSSTIGDVRGMGLLNAVEIVQDQATKAIFPGTKQASYRVSEIARDLGLHIYARRAASGKFGEWFMAAPPLIITEPEIELFTELLTETFRIFETESR